MRKINSLIDFLNIICNQDYWLEKSNYNDDTLLDHTKPVLKNFTYYCDLASEKGNKDEEVENILNSIIDQDYNRLYTYQYIHTQEKKLNTVEKKSITLFYRGVSNNSYLITSGIYRKNELHDENYYFNEINIRCPSVFRALNNLEKLTYMQHYGCPTRLLDITSNPLVALYFSCLEDNDSDGCVYIFGVDSDDVLYSDNDRVQMLSKLAELKRNDQKQLRRLAYRYMLKNKFPQSSNGRYQNNIIERYYHSIKRNNGAFEREMVPFDILKPIFVQPNKDNPRILKQDGAFIISGLDMDEFESDMKIRKNIITEITIESKFKKQILKELEIVGVNQATLFPEVDKVADYLKKKH